MSKNSLVKEYRVAWLLVALSLLGSTLIVSFGVDANETENGEPVVAICAQPLDLPAQVCLADEAALD